MIRAAVIGGSGYIGGELLRLLLGHPLVDLAAATSTRLAGRRIDSAHPNLRNRTDLVFVEPSKLDLYDVVFVAMAHTETMVRMPDYLSLASVIIDLSGDFRLHDPDRYEFYYRAAHSAPELLPTFVTGLPELHRHELTRADRISVPGCMATAAILALLPLCDDELIVEAVSVDARTGSSGAGVSAGPGNLHAERSGAMRVFAPNGHRHEAEVEQALGVAVSMTATGVEAVRGVQVVCRAVLADGVTAAMVRSAFRQRYSAEPFARVVAQRRGNYRLPEPKILTGSNFCDVGYAIAEPTRSVVTVGALDNLMKGGAGNAVQCMNIRFDWPEELGLEFAGLHPV